MFTYDEFKKDIKTVHSFKNCPVLQALEILNGKWTPRIIFELQKRESVRFGTLKSNLNGITNTMLSSTLKSLENNGIIVRKQYDEIPVRVEYSLTECGRDMLPIFYEIAKWGRKYSS